MVSIYITRIVHYANSSCLGLRMHINVVTPLGREPSFTVAVILLLAGGVSIYHVAKTVFIYTWCYFRTLICFSSFVIPAGINLSC